MKNKQDIDNRINFLRNVTKVQKESINELYSQAGELVNDNARIAKEIESLYASMRK